MKEMDFIIPNTKTKHVHISKDTVYNKKYSVVMNIFFEKEAKKHIPDIYNFIEYIRSEPAKEMHYRKLEMDLKEFNDNSAEKLEAPVSGVMRHDFYSIALANNLEEPYFYSKWTVFFDDVIYMTVDLEFDTATKTGSWFKVKDES